MSKFQIGETVWVARFEMVKQWLECPDCCGSGVLTVIKGDGLKVSIECTGCQSGYEPPKGRVYLYEHKESVRQTEITGIEQAVEDNKVVIKYRSTHDYIHDSAHITTTREEAVEIAQRLACNADREEKERFQKKEKPERSWAWNATYHRSQLKEAQKQVEYHSGKLAVAKLKQKGGVESTKI